LSFGAQTQERVLGRLYDTERVPDWDALACRVAARYSTCIVWAQRAVKQYRHFLDVKVQSPCVQRDPSELIDGIWHTHLSFGEAYQKDTLALTRGQQIIDYIPNHPKFKEIYYRNSYREHCKIMEAEGLAVDETFWPTPRDMEDDTESSFSEGDSCSEDCSLSCCSCSEFDDSSLE
jgi:hypothetical protein